jgi:beta-fructofuranosidase
VRRRVLRLPDRWIWDSWPVDVDDEHHLFYLQAPKSIGDPELRHHHATIGHAVSTDYVDWRVLPDALAPSTEAGWDDFALWTGSVVRGETGTWHLFYTALSRAEHGLVQRIGRADSDDLISWRRVGSDPLVQADPRWYETLDPRVCIHQSWRDPWVLPDPGGDGWHMLITARVAYGEPMSRGVLGHARSADLLSWEVQPPLTTPAGFGWLEVPQVTVVGGRPVLVFCCLAAELSAERRLQTPVGGMWSAPAQSLLGPYALEAASPFPDPTLYAARVVDTGEDQKALLGFSNLVEDAFVGAIPPPTPVRLSESGVLEGCAPLLPVTPAATVRAEPRALEPGQRRAGAQAGSRPNAESSRACADAPSSTSTRPATSPAPR